MHITIAGNIGAGKTTLAQKLATHYNWKVLFEAVDGNPYLSPFYDDMARWSFHLQIFFLNSRFEQVLKIKSLTENQTIIQDRSIYEDAYIFAKNLHDSKIMNDVDFETYQSLFNTITSAISPPDLMIYLKADMPKLLRQIKKRGRGFESNIDPQYLENLNELYENFADNYDHGKILIIDVNDLDYALNEADFEEIIKQIEKNINIGGNQLSI